MAKTSLTYRFARLAVLLGFALGIVLPAVCQQGTAHASEMAEGHSEVPCAGPCHVLEVPTDVAPAPLLKTDRLPESPDVAPERQLSRAGHAALFQHREIEGIRRSISPGSPPVRLHVFHAVFLN